MRLKMDSRKLSSQASAFARSISFSADKPEQLADFQLIKIVGEGNFGVVSLYEYLGHDPLIRKLCNAKNQVVIKKYPAGEADYNDINNSTELFSYAYTNNLTKNASFGLAIPFVSLANEPIGLISKYITYKDDTDAADVETFLTGFSQNASFKLDPNVNSDIAIIISKIISSMYRALGSVHAAKFLHRDFSARNLLLDNFVCDADGNIVDYPVVLIDMGLSTKINEKELARYDHATGPVRWSSKRMLSTRLTNVVDDLFQLKTTIIEMLALAAGVTCDDVLCFDKGEPLHETAIRKISPDQTDDMTLSHFLANAIKVIQGCEGSLKEELMLIIDCYKSYITYIPDEHYEISTAQNNDYINLLKATERFADVFIAYRINKIKNKYEVVNGSDSPTSLNHKIEDIQELLITLRSLKESKMYSEDFMKSQAYLIIKDKRDVASLGKHIFGENFTMPSTKMRRHNRHNASITHVNTITQTIVGNGDAPKRQSKIDQLAPIDEIIQTVSQRLSKTENLAPMPTIAMPEKHVVAEENTSKRKKLGSFRRGVSKLIGNISSVLSSEPDKPSTPKSPRSSTLDPLRSKQKAAKTATYSYLPGLQSDLQASSLFAENKKKVDEATEEQDTTLTKKPSEPK